MNHTSPLLFAFAGLGLLAGCGSGDDAGKNSSGATANPANNACAVQSGFPGDELCIAPPKPGEGIQIHAGPVSYDNPDDTADWVIGPGEENVRCLLAEVPGGGFYYLKQENRMRSGSHHMLIFLNDAAGLSPGLTTTGCSFTNAVGSIPGSQSPSRELPGELAAEDAGLGRWLPEHTMAGFQLHYVNTRSEVLLREAWVNLYEKPEAEVTDPLQGVFMLGDLGVNIPANTRQTTAISYTPPLTEPVRVVQMLGHSHAHSETFSVWRSSAGANRELVYKSFNWEEPIELTFNSIAVNPAPNDAAKTDGGHSGTFMLNPGDTLEWECVVNNTTNAALRFANEAYTAEMCLLGGSYIYDTAGPLRGPCRDGTCTNVPLPGGAL